MKLYIGLIWILTTATALVAFPAPLHRRITEDVLRRLLPPHLDIAYSQFAIAEIVNANECTDVGPEMFQQDPDTPCIPNRSSLVEFRGAQSRAQDHFDDERISDGVLRLQALRAWIAADIADGRYVMVRKRIGAAAHAIQDFYAHTNWIELGIATFFEDKHGNFAFRQPNRLLRVASKYEDVCIAIHRDRYNQEVTVQPNLLPEATGGDGTVLTSGYFFSSVRGVAKCLHGLVSPGIAKDLPIGEGKYNRAAEDLATRHTEQFVQSIIEQLLGDTRRHQSSSRCIWLLHRVG